MARTGITTFKICVVGDTQTGKSTWIRLLQSLPAYSAYNPTAGVEVTGIEVTTDYGLCHVRLWDCSGNPNFQGLGDGYHVGSDAFIVFGDAPFSAPPHASEKKRKKGWKTGVVRVSPFFWEEGGDVWAPLFDAIGTIYTSYASSK